MRSLVLIEVSFFLSLPEGLRIEWVEPQGADLSVGVVSLLPSSCCPLCAQASSQVHSQYQRTLHDVPCGGRKVVLHLSVRKFFCRNPDCARKIFTERLPSFVQPWAQVTTRLFEAVGAGHRACYERGIGDTTRRPHRHVCLTHHHSSPHYGSCVTLITTGFPVRDRRLELPAGKNIRHDTRGLELATASSISLPLRDAETAAGWMRKHPEIEVVSRDRGGDYASAAALGAPQAVQCADRFHVLKNLREGLEGLLARHLAAKRKKKTQETLDEHAPVGGQLALSDVLQGWSVSNKLDVRSAWPSTSK